jgi:hypothetical protein
MDGLEVRQRRELASCLALALQLNESLRLGVVPRAGAPVPEVVGAVVGAALARYGDTRGV